MKPFVNVLGKRYQLVEKKTGCGGSRYFGETNHRSLQIELDADQVEAQKRDTLLHETLHAIDYAMHLELDERQVHALAAGVLCVMRDNPELIDWLMQED